MWRSLAAMSNKPQDMADPRKRVAEIQGHYSKRDYMYDTLTVQKIVWLCDELIAAWDREEQLQMRLERAKDLAIRGPYV